MVKLVIHTADIHIRTYKMHREYRAAFQKFIEQVKELTKDLKREEIRIVIAGDLVHQKITISNEMILLTIDFLKALEQIAPLVIIAGNHDLLENNRERIDSITPIVSFFKGSDVTYYTDSDCYEDDNIVWCVYSIFEGNRRPDIESARKEYGDDKKYVGLYHAPIVGAKTDIGYKLEHGGEIDLFDGCDVAMLGDIHKHQEFNHNNVKIVYPSSLIQQDFGENISGHGFLAWDMDNLTYKFHEVQNDYGFYKFKIASPDDVNDNKEKLVNK